MGWVSALENKADYALSCFLTSEYSQSDLYYGKIASLPYLVQRYSNDPIELQSAARDSLEGLIQRYFGEENAVEVNVTEDSDKPGQLTIRFNCIIRENNRSYSLGKQVETLNGRVTRIAKINNG